MDKDKENSQLLDDDLDKVTGVIGSFATSEEKPIDNNRSEGFHFFFK